MRKHEIFLAAAIATLAAACGAKTGLLVPDWTPVYDATADVAMTDAPTSDTFVRFEACVAGEFTLERRSAEMMFVIDRSGSMSTPLASADGGLGNTRWTAMQSGLSQTLPSITNQVELGAIFFPEQYNPELPYGLQMCAVSTYIDVQPDLGTAGHITHYFTTTSPNGGTPTAAALTAAGRVFAGDTSRAHSHYLVLATDGGPNCNSMLDATMCQCFDDTGSDPMRCSDDPLDGALYCLDETRTLGVISGFAAQQIFTYVIGIYDPTEPTLSTVLDNMAVAGMRPNTSGAHRYYSVNVTEDLTTAFQSIVQTVAQCAFVTPSRPDDPDAISIEYGGQPIAHDTTHMDGWDWTDEGYGEITLYGAACDAAREGGGDLTAIVMCR